MLNEGLGCHSWEVLKNWQRNRQGNSFYKYASYGHQKPNLSTKILSISKFPIKLLNWFDLEYSVLKLRCLLLKLLIDSMCIERSGLRVMLFVLLVKTFSNEFNDLVKHYTANVYRQRTDKLMLKSVISTVRWIRK